MQFFLVAFCLAAWASPRAVAQNRLHLQGTNDTQFFSSSARSPVSVQADFFLLVRNDITAHSGDAPKSLELSWRIENLAGQIAIRRDMRISLSRGTTVVNQVFEITRLGVYRLHVTALDRTKTGSRQEYGQATLGFAATASETKMSSRAPVEFGLEPRDESDKRDLGALISLPLPGDVPETSAATLRALLARRKSTPEFGCSLRGEEQVPAQAAHVLVARATTAIAAGARRIGAMMPGVQLPEGRVHYDERTLAQRAAWNAMVRQIGNALFDVQLFPSAPLLRGMAFENGGESGKSRVAVIWAERNHNPHARLVAALPQARLFDIWGNEITRAANAQSPYFVVPLGGAPVYVVSDAPRKVWDRAWRNARLEGLRPLAVQVLALNQNPGPRNQDESFFLRVRVQNMALTPFRGELQAQPPSGWSLVKNSQPIFLKTGETRVLNFPVAVSQKRSDGLYAVSVAAMRGASRWNWKQNARVALAGKMRRNQVVIDGDLREWRGAAWMRIEPKKYPPSLRGAPGISAQIALGFDATNLYIAAKVIEPHLQARPPRAESYEFWHGFDALQLVFGGENTTRTRPRPAPFRDTDHGFLLCPFELRNGVPAGRVLRLWSPRIPFEPGRDRLRWGGAVPGANCAITRDEKKHLTIYEASLPLHEMPHLQPQRRADGAIAVRFSWKLHDENASLSWSRAANVFPWLAGNGSFWPPEEISYPSQTPLGFTNAASQPDVLPLPVARQKTMPRRPRRNPPTTTANPPAAPPLDPALPPDEIAPMSPRLLPPAAPPPSGQALPPSAPNTN